MPDARARLEQAAFPAFSILPAVAPDTVASPSHREAMHA